MKPDETKRRSIVVCGKGGGSSTVTWDDIQDKPDFAEVATSGDYEDLENTPSLATVATSGSYNDLSNTPTLATVATTGDYEDLSNTPTLATVATSGSYNDLSNTPSLATVATTGDYEDLSNKPTIPVMPPMATETITFLMEGGVTRTVDFYVVPNYFYVQDVSGSNNTLSIKKNYVSAPDIEVFYSTDKANWTSMGITSTTAITATIPANGKLYLKATANAWCRNSDSNTIKASGTHNIGGNIMSLIYGDNFEGQTSFPPVTFYSNTGFTQLFFEDTQLINANNLTLPLTDMLIGTYNAMFWGCTNLLTAPSTLPATILVKNCYSGMFRECTSLTTSPVIMATTATGELALSSMFNGCTALNKVTSYLTDISGNNCLMNWLNNVAATGDFYNLGGIAYPSGASGIPTGWIEHTSL